MVLPFLVHSTASTTHPHKGRRTSLHSERSTGWWLWWSLEFLFCHRWEGEKLRKCFPTHLRFRQRHTIEQFAGAIDESVSGLDWSGLVDRSIALNWQMNRSTDVLNGSKFQILWHLALWNDLLIFVYRMKNIKNNMNYIFISLLLFLIHFGLKKNCIFKFIIVIFNFFFWSLSYEKY